MPPGYYHAFVELHIEQGPLLERGGIPLGVVTAIAAPATLNIEIEGEGGHAGARADARSPRRISGRRRNRARRGSGGASPPAPIDTVATVGICEVFPGAVNSIPSRVRMTVDVRDIDLARRDAVLAAIRRALRARLRQRAA